LDPAETGGDAPGQNPGQRNTAEVREDALLRIQENPERILADYKERFGNVLNADNAAEIFPAYAASVESRTRFRVAVHPAAQWVRDELFRRSLTDPDVHQVIFTAGGNGAGKTSGGISGDLVMDSTLSNREHSESLLQAALDAGKEVAVVYTYRPILDSLNGVLDRSMTEGRTVSISTLIKAHEGAVRSVAAIYDKYFDDPSVRFPLVDKRRESRTVGRCT
jgi:hypothetical protein